MKYTALKRKTVPKNRVMGRLTRSISIFRYAECEQSKWVPTGGIELYLSCGCPHQEMAALGQDTSKKISKKKRKRKASITMATEAHCVRRNNKNVERIQISLEVGSKLRV
jgi:hypothetical protein